MPSTSEEIPIVPADRTPYVIRTGDEVRVIALGHPEHTGRFLGYGIDSITDRPLLFVQIGAGVHSFEAADTRLEEPNEQ